MLKKEEDKTSQTNRQTLHLNKGGKHRKTQIGEIVEEEKDGGFPLLV